VNCLVTGGAGFIGSHIVDALLREGHRVSVVDNLSTGNRSQINADAQFFEMDLADPALGSLMAEGDFEVVYHLAAQTDVMTSVREPAADAQVNIVDAIKLLDLCRQHGVRKVIYSSTSALFGDPQSLPMDEDHPIAPLCPYAASKHTVEHYLDIYREIHGLSYTVLRYANAYGPRQDPHHEGGVLAIFAFKILTSAVPIIYGDGEQTRDYVHVEDLVRANLLCLEQGDNTCYNLGTGVETTVNELFAMLCDASGMVAEVKYAAERRGEMRRLSLASDRAKADFAWQPTVSLHEGIRSVLDYFKENDNGIL
jgi:UDP-glucose 4-epimerase